MYKKLFINKTLQSNEFKQIIFFLEQKNISISFVETKTDFTDKDNALFIGINAQDSDLAQELNIDFEVYILGDNQGYKNFYKLNDKDYPSQYIDVDYKEMALLMLSSGTTGSPKMIPMKHCELICSAIAIGSALNYSDATIYLMALSLSHKFVLSYPGIIGVFYHGAKCVISMTPSPDEIIYNIEEHNISTMALVPALASLCMDFLEFEKINIRNEGWKCYREYI